MGLLRVSRRDPSLHGGPDDCGSASAGCQRYIARDAAPPSGRLLLRIALSRHVAAVALSPGPCAALGEPAPLPWGQRARWGGRPRVAPQPQRHCRTRRRGEDEPRAWLCDACETPSLGSAPCLLRTTGRALGGAAQRAGLSVCHRRRQLNQWGRAAQRKVRREPCAP